MPGGDRCDLKPHEAERRYPHRSHPLRRPALPSVGGGTERPRRATPPGARPRRRTRAGAAPLRPGRRWRALALRRIAGADEGGPHPTRPIRRRTPPRSRHLTRRGRPPSPRHSRPSEPAGPSREAHLAQGAGPSPGNQVGPLGDPGTGCWEPGAVVPAVGAGDRGRRPGDAGPGVDPGMRRAARTGRPSRSDRMAGRHPAAPRFLRRGPGRFRHGRPPVGPSPPTADPAATAASTARPCRSRPPLPSVRVRSDGRARRGARQPYQPRSRPRPRTLTAPAPGPSRPACAPADPFAAGQVAPRGVRLAAA